MGIEVQQMSLLAELQDGEEENNLYIYIYIPKIENIEHLLGRFYSFFGEIFTFT